MAWLVETHVGPLEVRQPIKKDALVSSARQNKCQPQTTLL